MAGGFLLPATLPYIFPGFRLSLGIAWLVIVAAEMLTGQPGVGGFLWQEYNSLIYEHIILCIITIGVVGFILDRLMSLVERWRRAGAGVTFVELAEAPTLARWWGLLSAQAEMADLVRLGAYRAGTDAAVDEALRLAPRIEAVLAQGKGERGTVEHAFAALAAAMEEEDGGGDAA